MSVIVKHARADGSYVIERDGLPYHVTPGDPLHADVAVAATGLTLPPEIAPAPVTLPVPPLSPSQFAGALMLSGIISAAEAEEFAASGAIPATLMAAINSALDASTLSSNERAIVRIKLRGALEYHRSDPAVPLLAAALNLDDDALDALWAAGRTI